MKLQFRTLAIALALVIFATPAKADLWYNIAEGARMASVHEEFEKSFKLYMILAKIGDGWPQERVAMMYKDGEGVPVDLVQSYKWYTIAAASDYGDQPIEHLMSNKRAEIGKTLKELAAKMSSEQVAEAKKNAAEWQPSEKIEIPPELITFFGADEKSLQQEIDQHAEQMKRNKQIPARYRNPTTAALRSDMPDDVEEPDTPMAWPGDFWPGNTSPLNERHAKEDDHPEQEKLCFEGIDSAKVVASIISDPVPAEVADGGIVAFDRLTFRRTQCFGSCPVYEITVKNDGTMLFQGDMYVEKIGLSKAALSASQIEALVEALNAADYLKKSEIDFSQECSTDSPSVLMSLKVGSKEYKINHYHGTCTAGSNVLRDLENKIDTVTQTSQWVGKPDIRQQKIVRSNSARDTVVRFKGQAEEGIVAAQRALGDAYSQGCGARGKREALSWWKKAAEQGDLQSINRLAAAYAKSADYSEAESWWLKVAEEDPANSQSYLDEIPEAQRYLGHLYMEGKGHPVNYAEAYYWYSLAADNLNIEGGHSQEQTNSFRNAVGSRLGKKRYDAVTQRLASSKYSLQGRAARGDAMAQYGLAQKYYQGIGIEKDFTQAMQLMKKSASQGFKKAQEALGLMYASGQEGIEYNPKEAVFWMGVSGTSTGDAGATYRKELESLSLEDRQKVEKRIKEWKSVPPAP